MDEADRGWVSRERKEQPNHRRSTATEQADNWGKQQRCVKCRYDRNVCCKSSDILQQEGGWLAGKIEE